MTNLMHQLQAWADKGWYTFPCKQHPEGVFDGDGWEEIYNIESNFRYNLADAMDCVLDGTIQVWRPVEHYKPKDDERVLLFDPTHTDEYGEPLTTVIGYYREEDGEFHRFEIYRNSMSLMSPTHWQPLPQPPQEGAMLELEPIVLNEKNHYIMYTLVEDFGGCDHIFENGERRMVWHRQSAFDTKEEVMAHFEDYCQKYPNMSYIIVTPKIYLEEPHKTIVAGLITARTIYSGVDQWTRSVNKLSEDYNIIAERRVK